MKFVETVNNFLKKLYLDLKNENWLVVFLLSILVGFYTILCLIAVFLPDGIIEQEEIIIFVLGWIFVPTISIFSIPFFLWLQSKFLGKFSDSLSILLAVFSLVFGLSITSINLSWQITKSLAISYYFTYISLLLIPLLSLLITFLIRLSNVKFSLTFLRILTVIGASGFVNFIGLFPYSDGIYSIPVDILVIALMSGIVVGLLPSINKFKLTLNRNLKYGIDILVFILIAITCFDSTFQILPNHVNFYLGPANQVIQGGTMLVDTFSQYGNLSIYFLALVFKSNFLPFSYQGFSLLIAILFAAQFIIVYCLLVKLVNNRFYVLLLITLSVLLGFFSTMGFIQTYPSTGPYRFGLIYLLLAIILLRNQFPSFSKMFIFFEYFLVGVSFLWSIETFIYVGFSYLGICIFESFNVDGSIHQSLNKLTNRLAKFSLTLIITFGLFSLFTFIRAREFPNWDIYLDFIKTYTPSVGFGSLSMDAWSPWIFPIGIYFSSLMIFLFRYFYLNHQNDNVQEKIILGLTFFGIAQYTYYLGRSHPNALFHISTPSVIISGYWLIKILQKEEFPKIMNLSARVVLFSAAILIILGSWPSLRDKYQGNHTGLTILSNLNQELLAPGNIQKWLRSENALLKSNTQNPQIAETHNLIEKYFFDQKKIPIFLAPDISTEILFTEKRTHSFPIGNFVEDAISDKNVKRIMDVPSPLKNGDYIIIEKNPLNYENFFYFYLAARLLIRICQDFSFEEIESSNHGVSVVRLIPPDNSSAEYCKTIYKLKQH